MCGEGFEARERRGKERKGNCILPWKWVAISVASMSLLLTAWTIFSWYLQVTC